MATGDNIEQYFKKKLTEVERSEEEWMVPSDDIWESAKVHFPKKKKKDRAIFFWWGLGVLVVGLGAGIVFFLMKDEVRKDSLVATIDKNEINTKRNVLQEGAKTKNKESLVKKEKAIGKHEVKQQDQSIINNTEIQESIENSRSASVQKTISSSQTKKVKIITSAKQQIFADTPLITEVNNNATSPSIPSTQIRKQDANSESLDRVSEVKSVIEIPTLTNTPQFLEVAKQEEKIAIPSSIIVSPIPLIIPKWEVGISYAPFLFIQESILNKGVGSPFDEQTVGLKHHNINFHVRRYLAPRFSLSSGLYSSKGELDFRFSDKAIYEQRNASTLRYFLKESSSTGTIKLSDLGIDIDATIAYAEDANLSNGDELIVKGEIPFKVKFVQLPLFMNLHFGKRKLKGSLHTGVSLDFQQLKAAILDFSISKDGQIISEPLLLDPLDEQNIKARWLVGAGIRYYLGSSFHIGTSLHINISDPILSRYDFGVYYGF